MATRLGAANASRVNGSTNGFGTLSGYIPKNDNRTSVEIQSTHDLIKRQQLAASRGDWDTYNSIANQLKFS